MAQIPPPTPILSDKEFDRRIEELKKRGITNPSVFDVDPDFKRWYFGGVDGLLLRLFGREWRK